MRERLAWSDTMLLRSLLVLLETQTWVKGHTSCASSADCLLLDDDLEEDCSLAEVKKAVEHISTHFRQPLQAKGLSFVSEVDEEIVEYAGTYLNINKTEYRKVWYKLFSCHDAGKWPSILILCELSFSVPFSNGRVEQIFSSLKVVKTNCRINLKSDTLNDLLEIYVEGPPLSSFCPDAAIELWWHDSTTTRRVNQQPRKDYQPRNPGSQIGTQELDLEEEEGLPLNMWDNWFDDSDCDTN